MRNAYLFFIIVIFLSCASESDHRETWLQEIRDTEMAFAQLSQEEGIRAAFLAYAAEDAVLLRGEKLVIGRDGIDQYLGEGPRDTTVSLTWTPDFVDVSSSGDLGYTYGKYVYAYVDSLGDPAESMGYFHTVWKRMENGEWKFVWD